MTRQQSITLAQVECKMYDAKRRALKTMPKLIHTKTIEEYNSLLDEGCKAAHDYEVWKTVYDALVN